MTAKIKHVINRAIVSPIQYFINDSRAVGITLIVNTIISIFLANALFSGEWYRNFWTGHFHISDAIHLPTSPLEWLNGFLMSFFFLMAGMEIKRELMAGELSSFKKAILPFGAALGGMAVPAIFFVAFNLHSGYVNGWGIPTATDIAFSLGVASLLGSRIPFGLKILLMALAIIDDLGAIVVIALFYGGQIKFSFLIIAGLLYAALLACGKFKLKFGAVQILLGLALWYAVFNSGIEASITGVLFAFALPIKYLPVIEKAIHRYVNFLIIPLFALANTAILIPSDIIGSLKTPLSMGIICGLVLGKPIGIFLFSRLLVALKLAKLPSQVKWNQILGMGILAGIGFTMSIFTTMLAFKADTARDISKIAILTSVILSLAMSIIYFLLISRKKGSLAASAKEAVTNVSAEAHPSSKKVELERQPAEMALS